jgi:hypothetical protein
VEKKPKPPDVQDSPVDELDRRDFLRKLSHFAVVGGTILACGLYSSKVAYAGTCGALIDGSNPPRYYGDQNCGTSAEATDANCGKYLSSNENDMDNHCGLGSDPNQFSDTGCGMNAWSGNPDAGVRSDEDCGDHPPGAPVGVVSSDGDCGLKNSLGPGMMSDSDCGKAADGAGNFWPDGSCTLHLVEPDVSCGKQMSADGWHDPDESCAAPGLPPGDPGYDDNCINPPQPNGHDDPDGPEI